VAQTFREKGLQIGLLGRVVVAGRTNKTRSRSSRALYRCLFGLNEDENTEQLDRYSPPDGALSGHPDEPPESAKSCEPEGPQDLTQRL
jgi:hypothetical protein